MILFILNFMVNIILFKSYLLNWYLDDEDYMQAIRHNKSKNYKKEDPDKILSNLSSYSRSNNQLDVHINPNHSSNFNVLLDE